MTEALMNHIKAQLVRHEVLRLKPYRCTVGKLTIGIGQNLDVCGISQTESYVLFENEIQDCEQWFIKEKSSYYWQGLAEHTALKILEFLRLRGYKKAKAKYYKLVVILDDRISDIYRALPAQDKNYHLNDTLEIIDNLMVLDIKCNNLDDAKDYIKTLAPWIKDEQIEYDSDIHPVGVFGAHTPFPPFHWKCRTTTHIWTA